MQDQHYKELKGPLIPFSFIFHFYDMILGAGIVTFQDRNSLKRCLDSLSDFREVIVIDGAYAGYPSENRYSTDGTYELCKKYHNVRVFTLYDKTEIEKRTLYLKLAAELDVTHLLIIDSDEWLVGKFENLPTERGVYSVDFCNSDGNHWHSPRLIVDPRNYEYWGAHCVIKDLTTGSIFRLKSENVVKGVTIHSDDKLRKPEYQVAWEKYRDIQKPMERPVKDRYS